MHLAKALQVNSKSSGNNLRLNQHAVVFEGMVPNFKYPHFFLQ